jgi:hypothetical protein
MPKKQRCHVKNIVRICEKLLTLALLLDASMTAESDRQLRRTAGRQIFRLPLRGKPMLDIGLWHFSEVAALTGDVRCWRRIGSR